MKISDVIAFDTSRKKNNGKPQGEYGVQATCTAIIDPHRVIDTFGEKLYIKTSLYFLQFGSGIHSGRS